MMGFFLFATAFRPTMRSAQPLIQCLLGKVAGVEANYKHPSSGGTQNA
jgi:hypothetical protein